MPAALALRLLVGMPPKVKKSLEAMATPVAEVDETQVVADDQLTPNLSQPENPTGDVYLPATPTPMGRNGQPPKKLRATLASTLAIETLLVMY